MFIHVHQAEKRTPLGLAGAWCPVCRGAQRCTAFRVGKQLYVSGIPIGARKNLHEELECQACGCVRAESLGTVQATALAAEANLDAEGLLASTMPSDLDDLPELLAHEDAIADGRLGPSERIAEIARIIGSLDLAMKRRRTITWTPTSRWLMLLAALVSLSSIALLVRFPPRRRRGFGTPDVAITAIVASFVMMLVGLWIAGSQWRRYRRDIAEPAIAGSIAILRPTEQELEAARRSVRRTHRTIAGSVSVQRIMSLLTRPSAR